MSLGLYSLGLASLGLTYGRPRVNYGFLLFNYKPNFNYEVTETLTWDTQIHQSQNGREQRTGKRLLPRVIWQYKTFQANQSAQDLEHLLYGATYHRYALPNWVDGAMLTQPAPSGDLKLHCQTDNRSFFNGGYLVVIAPNGLYDFARINEVQADGLTVLQDMLTSFMPGAIVYPIVFGKISGQVNWLSSAAAEFDLTVELSSIDTDFNLPVDNAINAFNGVDVLNARSNWTGDTSQTINLGYTIIDNGINDVDRFYVKKHARNTIAHNWFCNSKNKLNEFRAFLQKRKGMLQAFYYARPLNDAVLAEPIQADDLIIRINGTSLIYYVGQNKGRDALAFLMPNNNTIYKHIVNAELNAGTTLITVETQFSEGIGINEPLQISYLSLYRLKADAVSINYIANDFATPITYFEQVIE